MLGDAFFTSAITAVPPIATRACNAFMKPRGVSLLALILATSVSISTRCFCAATSCRLCARISSRIVAIAYTSLSRCEQAAIRSNCAVACPSRIIARARATPSAKSATSPAT